MDMKRHLKSALKQLGFDKPRKAQIIPMNTLDAGQDAIVIAATGSGKQVIYETVGLAHSDKLTIVIEPLLALIYNQVQTLQEHDVSADYIDMTRSKEDIDKILNKARKGKLNFLYVTPERLQNRDFVDAMLYDGFLIYASTQEILCKALKKLRLKAPTDILEPQEGEILKIDRNGRITTGAFAPRTSYEHWWRHYSPYYRDFCVDAHVNYDDLFSVAKAFGVSADEVQALLDYGCSEEEIEEMLYDPTLLHEMTGELLYAY